jgi:hypothetical protein
MAVRAAKGDEAASETANFLSQLPSRDRQGAVAPSTSDFNGADAGSDFSGAVRTISRCISPTRSQGPRLQPLAGCGHLHGLARPSAVLRIIRPSPPPVHTTPPPPPPDP